MSGPERVGDQDYAPYQQEETFPAQTALSGLSCFDHPVFESPDDVTFPS